MPVDPWAAFREKTAADPFAQYQEQSARPDLTPPGMPKPVYDPSSQQNPIQSAGREDILGQIPDNLYTRTGARIKQNLNLPAQIPALADLISGVIKQGVGKPPTLQEFNQKVLQPFYQQYKGKPENVAGDVTTAFITGGGELPIPSGRRMVPGEPPVAPEMALTSALRKSPKVNVTAVAPDALPALREAAGYLDVTPGHFQGPEGVALGQKLVGHALDVLESKFSQLIGPVRQEAITPAMIEKYPDLAEYLGKDSPTTVNDINAARTAKGNQFYSKSPNTQQGATGNLLDAKKIHAQAADFLYDYIQKRTGVDPSGIKAQQSALLKLKPVMDRTVADTLKAEADFQMNPKTAKSNVLHNALQAARAASGSVGAGADLLQQAIAKHAPSISPAETFNARMRLALGDIPKAGPPAMRAPNLVGGPQEFAPALTQFGGGTGNPLAVSPQGSVPPEQFNAIQQARNELGPNASLNQIRRRANNIQQGFAPNQFGSRTGEPMARPQASFPPEQLNAIREGGEATRRSSAQFMQDVIRRQGLPTDPSMADIEAAVKGRAAEMSAKYPVPQYQSIRDPFAAPSIPSELYNPEVVGQHASALDQAKSELGPKATLSQLLQRAAKIQRGGP